VTVLHCVVGTVVGIIFGCWIASKVDIRGK
jgi:uncharacterized protein YneF (UPF0154 family)